MACLQLQAIWCIGEWVRVKLSRTKTFGVSNTLHINIYSKSNIEGLPLNGRMLTLCLLGMDGRLDKYRDCNQVWIIAGISVPANALGSSSSYLVALIVLLRLQMIRNPFSYASTHKGISIAGCIIIWFLSILVPSLQVVVSFPSLYDVTVYNTFVAIDTYGLLTAPIVLTLLVYVILQYSIKQQVAINDAGKRKIKSLAKMTHGIVAGLIVCNVPGLLIMAYLTSRLDQGTSEELFESNSAV